MQILHELERKADIIIRVEQKMLYFRAALSGGDRRPLITFCYRIRHIMMNRKSRVLSKLMSPTHHLWNPPVQLPTHRSATRDPQTSPAMWRLALVSGTAHASLEGTSGRGGVRWTLETCGHRLRTWRIQATARVKAMLSKGLYVVVVGSPNDYRGSNVYCAISTSTSHVQTLLLRVKVYLQDLQSASVRIPCAASTCRAWSPGLTLAYVPADHCN